eukprot:TRINITY_DN2471_c0_g1_i3.p1 TRINITY_DN2471_c0_g1~~TRINITY_DN2471_c0_g1_i3.p1  ORF type:complete len:185 (+),score=72.39 TRINITY_DN2471_c0_g1_i3:106-660(+)
MEEAIPSELQSEYKMAYDAFDKTGDQKLTSKELVTILNALFPQKDKAESSKKKEKKLPTEEELNAILEKVGTAEDENGIKYIDFPKFLRLMTILLAEEPTNEEIFEAFRVFDPEKMNAVKTSELRYAFSKLDPRPTDEEVDELIKEFDMEGLGYLKYGDLIKEFEGKIPTPSLEKDKDLSLIHI